MERKPNLSEHRTMIELASIAVLLFLIGGCSWFKTDLSKQYLAENERLIREYRLERDRAAQLEIQNRAMVSRIDTLEGRLLAISEAMNDPAIGKGSDRRDGFFQPAGLPKQESVNPGESTPATRLPAAEIPGNRSTRTVPALNDWESQQ